MDRLAWTRMRWRLRGAWLWPVFGVLTVVEAVLLNELPVWGDGPGGLVPGLLLAGCLNLIMVAVMAPLGGRLVRMRRPDLPKPIATDYAGTGLLVGLLALLFAGGLGQRTRLLEEREDRAAGLVAVAHYVSAQEPGYKTRLRSVDTMLVEDDVYRTCVPGADPDRWLCLFVDTGQRPPGVTRDRDRAPNSVYRLGGFE